jgi:hypothetical protein
MTTDVPFERVLTIHTPDGEDCFLGTTDNRVFRGRIARHYARVHGPGRLVRLGRSARLAWKLRPVPNRAGPGGSRP